ncbi:MAG: hypothetical protein ACRENQ_16130 [Gemmatimonadaceae bacterium]
MSETRLRSRSVSEIVDTAFQLYRQDAPQYIAVTAVAYAPWLIVRLLFLPAASMTPGSSALSLDALVVLFVSSLGTMIAFALMSAVIVRLGADAYLGAPGPRDIGATLRQVLPRVPAVLLAGIYKTVLGMIGLVLFLVGALYVAARYFALTTSIVLEDKTAWASLGRSSALSKGRKGHILLTLILVWVIFFVLSMAVGIVAGMIRSTVILTVLSTALTIVVYPVIGLTEMVLYYDARIRGEGFDVEVMAQGLGPTAAET